MNDALKEIKKRILEEDRVSELLEKMECENIKFRRNRYEAMLPAKFNSDDNRSVQVYLNESLSSRIRTRGISNIDIYHLVSYIMFDAYTIEEMNKYLPKSKQWICEKLDYDEFIDGFFIEAPKADHLKWLHDLKKKRNKNRMNEIVNQVYDEKILNQYVMYPWKGWLDEGIDISTQKFFNIGFDVYSERIIFPIRNRYGEIVSIKGRATTPSEYKYLYLYPTNKSIELFNLSNALYYILEKKEVIVVEGAKTVMKLWQHGYRNSVSIEGADISPSQIEILKSFGLDVIHIYALDRDKDLEFVKNQVGQIRTRTKFALIDNKGLFEGKDSPMDRGVEAFKVLYEQCRVRI